MIVSAEGVRDGPASARDRDDPELANAIAPRTTP